MTTGLNFSSCNRFIFNSLKLSFPQNGMSFDNFDREYCRVVFEIDIKTDLRLLAYISAVVTVFFFQFFEVTFSS